MREKVCDGCEWGANLDWALRRCRQYLKGGALARSSSSSVFIFSDKGDTMPNVFAHNGNRSLREKPENVQVDQSGIDTTDRDRKPPVEKKPTDSTDSADASPSGLRQSDR